MNFDFLKNTTLAQVEQKTTTTTNRTGRVAMERNPTNGASLRLFKDGSIYPSQETVDKYNLEYFGETGNGLDIIDSRQWAQYPQNAQPVVFVTAVPKKSGLVSLFSQAKGEDVSVMTQGSKTFGAELTTLLQEVYNVEDLFATQKYVDLVIVDNVEMPSADGIYNLPKKVAKGENKGQATSARRENITVNPLALFVPETNTTDDANDEAVAVLQEMEEETV